MNTAVISTNRDCLFELYSYNKSEKKEFFGECQYYYVNMGEGFPQDAFLSLGNEIDLQSVDCFILSDMQYDQDLAALIGVNLKGAIATSCSHLSLKNKNLKISREVYGGIANANLLLKKRPFVITFMRSFLAKYTGQRQDFDIKEIVVDKMSTNSKIISKKTLDKSVNLSSAKIIVSFGRGIKKKEDIDLIKNFAEKLNPEAELGCSRPISEDYKWMPIERQVGLTGEKVKPEIYFAIGISGQVQHLVGMRDSTTVIAINNNKNAPIFEYCDYGIANDLYEIIPLLIKKI